MSHWKKKSRRAQPSARRHGVFLAWKLIGTLLRSFGRVLIEGVKYYADQPRMLGKTFLRLVSLKILLKYILICCKDFYQIWCLNYSWLQERDFDKHVAYCRDEPAAQEFLQMNDAVRDYFEVSHLIIDSVKYLYNLLIKETRLLNTIQWRDYC